MTTRLNHGHHMNQATPQGNLPLQQAAGLVTDIVSNGVTLLGADDALPYMAVGRSWRHVVSPTKVYGLYVPLSGLGDRLTMTAEGFLESRIDNEHAGPLIVKPTSEDKATALCFASEVSRTKFLEHLAKELDAHGISLFSSACPSGAGEARRSRQSLFIEVELGRNRSVPASLS